MTQVLPSAPSPTGIASGVSADTSRLSSRENLEAAGQRFEAIFTGMMLKSMRAAKLGDGLFDNKAGEQFRDMMDGRIAESMAAHAPIGIGRALVDFLGKGQSAPAGAADAPASDGSTP